MSPAPRADRRGRLGRSRLLAEKLVEWSDTPAVDPAALQKTVSVQE